MRRLLVAALAAVLPLSLVGVDPGSRAAQAAAAAYSVTPLWLEVHVGVDDRTRCVVEADLYLPRGASGRRPVPAILGTNGFGGDKTGLASYGQTFAEQGYAVLAYSGLGFGGSTCRITLDNRADDGAAASELVSYLGGRRGLAFLDAGLDTPAPVPPILLDRGRVKGPRSKHDPRVGMVGGSYGGAVQFAAASIDRRIDAIVPIATWNDLTYSLAPNNANQHEGARVGGHVPGTTKLAWMAGFAALGMGIGVTHAGTDPSRVIGCPNFPPWVCQGVAAATVTGTTDPDTRARLLERSVATYVADVRVPTLLVQGQSDTLFNLNEAIATYAALRRQGTPVRMIWFNGGHSGPAAPGEIDETGLDVRRQYVTGRILGWFDHHLRGRPGGLGAGFAWFRDWVEYDGNARPAYDAAPAYPVSRRAVAFRLSGTDGLTTGTPVPGTALLTTAPLGAPTTLDPADVVGDVAPLEERSLPGTSAAWTSPPLDRPIEVVGVPVARLSVTVPTGVAHSLTEPGALTLFLKVLDVDAAGEATLVRDLVAPVRLRNVSSPFTVRLPALVHRFSAGHSVRLEISGGSVNYRGGLAGVPVLVPAGQEQVLRLPVR